jgi:hypothetical protein
VTNWIENGIRGEEKGERRREKGEEKRKGRGIA